MTWPAGGVALATMLCRPTAASAAPAEIGAVAAIEFKPGNRFVAAAEPVRRGGGSAMVMRPR